MSNVRKWELFAVVLVAGAVGYVWYGADSPPVEPPIVALPPMPAVEEQAAVPEIPGFRGMPPMGYRPNPEGTDKFLKSMDKPTIREAGPELFKPHNARPEGGTSLYQAPQEGAYPYRALFKAHQQVYGEEWVCGTQGIGDCVSWGWHHGVAIASAVEFVQGNTSEWKLPATEAIYGGARVEGSGHPGDGMKPYGGYSDGSYGGVAAKWVHTKGGILYREKYEKFDLSKYSPKVAKEWGAFGCGGRGDSGAADAIAAKHPCKRVALVATFEEAAAAIRSGYPVPVCSNQGFRSVRDADGFSAASGSWAHCMCFIAVRYDKPGLLCLNSWGPDWIKGPKFPSDQPDGSFWVSVNTVNRMLSGKDSFAVSAVDGFPFRPLDNADWVYNVPQRTVPFPSQYVVAP